MVTKKIKLKPRIKTRIKKGTRIRAKDRKEKRTTQAEDKNIKVRGKKLIEKVRKSK